MKEGNLVFDINGEFITEITREWFYTGEKSYETVMKILMDSMTGTDTPEAQIRRYAEDILLGRAALKAGSSKEGGFSYTIRARELLIRQRIRSESTQKRRKSSCTIITWKEDAKRRRTQYGRRELRDEQSNFNGTFNKRSRGEIHLRGKFIGNCQIHAGSR